MPSSAFQFCTALLFVALPVVASALQGAAPARAHSRPARRRGTARGRQRPPSGLASRCSSRARAPPSRRPTDMVTVHYTGWTTDGKMFDSSVRAATPRRRFPLDRRDQGLDRGRAADGRRREAPALDPGGARLQGPGRARPPGMLVFDVELLEIDRRRRRCAPADVAAAPADAKKTASGLAYKVLKEGTGRTHPSSEQPRHGALHGLDDRRQDVRQLGDARRAGDLRPRRRHRGLDRGRAADGGRREDALLDSRGARLQGPEPARRRACWSSTSSSSAIAT